MSTVPTTTSVIPEPPDSAAAAGPAGLQELREVLGNIARNSRTVAVWVLASRITGFGRIAVIAAVLGPTYFGNLFQFSNTLPVLIFGLMSGPLISAMLVPPLVRRIDSRDQAGACRLAGGFLGTIMAIFLAIAILGILATPLVLQVMTATVHDAETRREQLRVGLPLMAMLLPQLLCLSITGVSIAVQQANGRFALAAAAPLIENLGTMAAVGSSALLFGTGTEVRDVSAGQILLLGLGATSAVSLHAAVQWWGARRAGLRLIPLPGWRDPEIRRMFRMGVSSVGYTCLSWAPYVGMLVIASSVAGGVVAFHITNSFLQLPVALIAGPLAAVQLPRLSRSFDEGQAERIRNDLPLRRRPRHLCPAAGQPAAGDHSANPGAGRRFRENGRSGRRIPHRRVHRRHGAGSGRRSHHHDRNIGVVCPPGYAVAIAGHDRAAGDQRERNDAGAHRP